MTHGFRLLWIIAGWRGTAIGSAPLLTRFPRETHLCWICPAVHHKAEKGMDLYYCSGTRWNEEASWKTWRPLCCYCWESFIVLSSSQRALHPPDTAKNKQPPLQVPHVGPCFFQSFVSFLKLRPFRFNKSTADSPWQTEQGGLVMRPSSGNLFSLSLLHVSCLVAL